VAGSLIVDTVNHPFKTQRFMIDEGFVLADGTAAYCVYL
jgi:hypothetical protein